MPLKVLNRADDSEKHEWDINCLLFHNGKLYSGADDGKIKLWTSDLKLLKQVQAHPCSVYSITTDNNLLYSCSNEGTIKTFTLDTLEEKQTLVKDEQTEFTRVFYENPHLFSADNQGYVKVYNNNKFYGQLNVSEPIKDMLIDGTYVYTVKDLDLVITQVKLEGEKLQFGMKGTFPGRAPAALIRNDKKFCYSSRDARDIVVHSSEAENKFKQLTEIKAAHELVINTLAGRKLDNKTIIYSGGWDKIVKQWIFNEAEGKFIKDSECNVEVVVNVIINGSDNEQTLYVGGSDGHLLQLKYE